MLSRLHRFHGNMSHTMIKKNLIINYSLCSRVPVIDLKAFGFSTVCPERKKTDCENHYY
jgi:hypothetical protein